MPLDTATLEASIKTAFKKAKDTPPPADPGETGQAQEQILTQLAKDLAGAVNAFVRSGDVVQVTVQVRDLANAVIGSGAQTGTGKIQ
jgi:hypothetical protein